MESQVGPKDTFGRFAPREVNIQPTRELGVNVAQKVSDRDEKVCLVEALRRTWKLLNNCESLDEAKEQFKHDLVPKLILALERAENNK